MLQWRRKAFKLWSMHRGFSIVFRNGIVTLLLALGDHGNPSSFKEGNIAQQKGGNACSESSKCQFLYCIRVPRDFTGKLWKSPYPEGAQRLMQDMRNGPRFHWHFPALAVWGRRSTWPSSCSIPRCWNTNWPCLLLGSGCSCRILWSLNWGGVRADSCY